MEGGKKAGTGASSSLYLSNDVQTSGHHDAAIVHHLLCFAKQVRDSHSN